MFLPSQHSELVELLLSANEDEYDETDEDEMRCKIEEIYQNNNVMHTESNKLKTQLKDSTNKYKGIVTERGDLIENLRTILYTSNVLEQNEQNDILNGEG